MERYLLLSFLKIVHKYMSINKHEDCYYWPLWFSFLLPTLEQRRLSKILPKIQAAQLYLWRALNIYDDLLDGDRRPNQKLIIANAYYRRFLNIHFGLKLKNEYYKLLNSLLALWENTNKKELIRREESCSRQNSQLKKSFSLTSLADKSLILASGPLALLFYLNHNLKSPVTIAALDFWRCFLSAKQLSDDSRDWRDDLNDNIITMANSPIAARLDVHSSELNSKLDDIKLQTLFISHAAPMIISNLKTLGRRSRTALKKINSDKSPLILDKLIAPLEEAAQKSENFLKLSGLAIHKSL